MEDKKLVKIKEKTVQTKQGESKRVQSVTDILTIELKLALEAVVKVSGFKRVPQTLTICPGIP